MRFFERLIFFVLVALLPNLALCEPFRIGFTGEQSDNLLAGHGPYSRILSAALTDRLTRADPNADLGFSLSAARAMEVSADYAVWSFQIREETRFNNAMRVGPSDVVASLERCRRLGRFGSAIKSVFTGKKGSYDTGRWVSLEVDREQASENPSRVPLLMAECPIVERSSAAIFGDDLGEGTNLVANGPFVVSQVRPGRAIELERSRFVSSDLPGPDKLELRQYRNGFQALTALRTGGLDVLFTMDPEALDNAAGDRTLRWDWCMGSRVLARRGVILECPEDLDLSKLGYSS